MPNEGTAPRRLYSTLGFHLQARLAAHPEMRGSQETWLIVQKALREAVIGVEAAWEKRVMARAALEYADLMLDNAVHKIAAAAKIDLGGTVQKPEYEQLFRRLPGEIVALPLRQEIDEVRALESGVAGGTTWKSAKGLLPELKAARDATEKALLTYETARREWRKGVDRCDDVEVNWRHAYRALYGTVVEKFPADRRLQESFFYRADEGEESEEERRPDPTPGV